MNGIVEAPPQSYQEWLICLERIAAHNLAPDFLEYIKRGKLPGGPEVLGMFQRQLVQALNSFLEKKIKSFIKKLNQTLDSNDPANIVTIFRRFNNDLSKGLFFVDLEFLPTAVKTQLAESIQTRIREFQQEVIGHLQQFAEESNDLDLGVAVNQIKRIKILRPKVIEDEQL